MNTTTRFWIFAAIQFAVVSLIAIAVLRYLDAKAVYRDSVANARDCESLSAEIGEMRLLRSVADGGAAGNGDTQDKRNGRLNTAVIETLSQAAGISPIQLASIQPSSATRVEGTDYMRQQWVLSVRSVSTSQLIDLCIRAESDFATVKASEIELDAASAMRGPTPSGRSAPSAGPELWNARLILTQLVYDATRT